MHVLESEVKRVAPTYKCLVLLKIPTVDSPVKPNLVTMQRPYLAAFAKSGSFPTHTQRLNLLIKYLARLRRDGIIDDKDFSELVRRASATFIESQIMHRVDRALARAVPYEMLMRFGNERSAKQI